MGEETPKLLSLISLLLYSFASLGFIVFIAKYPHQSQERIWGMRLCYILGFAGVLAMRLSRGNFSELSLLAISSLIVSLITFELSTRFLK